MRRRFSLLMLCFLFAVLAVPAWAQIEDGFNLPSELYVLTNQGIVQQYGLGIAGMTTVTPESDFVLDFGLAPDGSWLAYRTEGALKLLNIYQPGTEMELDNSASVPPVRGQGETLVWSPNGDTLAYTTQYGARVAFNTREPQFATMNQGPLVNLSWSPAGSYLAAEVEGNIWWIYRRDGTTITLASAIPSSAGLAWISDSELIFAPGEGGLVRMNLANANQQSILLDDTWTYRLPYERPSGDLVVFGRQKGGDTAPEFGRLIGLAANTPQVANLSEVSLDTSGLRWAPGGEMLVTLRGGVLLLVVPTATQGLPLPISDAVAYSWGPSPVEHANAVPEAVGIFFRAPGLDNLVQIWQVGSDGTALPLTGSEADVTAYAVSPDGRRLVYASAGELRLQPLNVTEEPLVLAQIGTQSVSGIAFSPDGGQVAYALDSDNQHPAGGIYIVPASGGEAALLLQNGPEGESPVYAPPFYRDPQFAPNVNALLVRESGSETTSFLMLDLNTDERLRVGSYDATFWLRDGRLIAYGNGIGIGDPPPTTPIYLIATDALDRPVQIAALPAPRIIRAIQEITSGRLRLAVADNVPGPSPLDVLDIAIATGEETVITRAGFIAQPALSRDGQILAGIVNPGSLLTVYDLFNRQQLALDSPLGVADFRWPLR